MGSHLRSSEKKKGVTPLRDPDGVMMVAITP